MTGLHYKPPEWIQSDQSGNEINAIYKVDAWSLGIILMEMMLAGYPDLNQQFVASLITQKFEAKTQMYLKFLEKAKKLIDNARPGQELLKFLVFEGLCVMEPSHRFDTYSALLYMKKCHQGELMAQQDRQKFKEIEIQRSQERSKGAQKFKEHELKFNYITYRSTLDFENLDANIEISAFCDPPFTHSFCPLLPRDGRFIKLEIGNRSIETVQIQGIFPVSLSALFIFNQSMIMAGGYLNNTYLRAHFELNSKSFNLHSKLYLPEARSRSCGCAVDQNCYAVISGIDGMYSDKFPNFLYSEIKQEWALIPSLNQQRFGAACIALSGKLYILGGTWIEAKPRSSIEMWDKSSQQWRFIFEKSPYSGLFQRQQPALLAITKQEFIILGGVQHNSNSRTIPRINVEKEEIREYQDIAHTLQFWYGKMAVFGEDSCIYLEGVEQAMLSEGKFMGLQLHERGGSRLGVANFYAIDTVKKQ